MDQKVMKKNLQYKDVFSDIVDMGYLKCRCYVSELSRNRRVDYSRIRRVNFGSYRWMCR